jgi:hypothetical protein
MSYKAIEGKLTIKNSDKKTEIAQKILVNKSALLAEKLQKTAEIDDDLKVSIMEQLSEIGVKNSNYAEGLARQFGCSKEQAQLIIDELENSIS